MTYRCEYDSGSMYGNANRCSDAATVEIVYTIPTRVVGAAAYACQRHSVPMQARLYPYELSVRDLTPAINDTLAASADAIARTERLAFQEWTRRAL